MPSTIMEKEQMCRGRLEGALCLPFTAQSVLGSQGNRMTIKRGRPLWNFPFAYIADNIHAICRQHR